MSTEPKLPVAPRARALLLQGGRVRYAPPFVLAPMEGVTHRTFRDLILSLGGVGAAMMLGGCRGDREDAPPRQFFPDMDDMPRWKVQGESEFFKDKRMLRQPVSGSVPFSRQSMSPEAYATAHPAWADSFAAQRDVLLTLGDARETGQTGPDAFVDTIPIPVDRELVELGKKKFDIYCAACHGFQGDGKGMVGRQWSYDLPNWHEAKYKDRKEKTGKDGYLFHTARHGVVDAASGTMKMPPYAHALSVRETWGVVAYIRALQKTREGVADDLSAAERAELDAKRATPSGGGAAPSGGTPAAPAGGKS